MRSSTRQSPSVRHGVIHKRDSCRHFRHLLRGELSDDVDASLSDPLWPGSLDALHVPNTPADFAAFQHYRCLGSSARTARLAKRATDLPASLARRDFIAGFTAKWS